MAIKELSNVQIKSGNDWYKLCPFPVGYIYISYTNTSPATTYGGTWSSISGGKYLRAAAASSTGGSNTISISQMPSHTHNIRLSAPNKGWYSGDEDQWAAFYSPEDNSDAYITSTGGGRLSTRHIKMYMLGEGLPSSLLGGDVND